MAFIMETYSMILGMMALVWWARRDLAGLLGAVGGGLVSFSAVPVTVFLVSRVWISADTACLVARATSLADHYYRRP